MSRKGERAIAHRVQARRRGASTTRLAAIFTALGLIAVLLGAIAVISLRMTMSSKRRLVEAYDRLALETEQLQVANERRARKLRTWTITDDPQHRVAHQQAREEFLLRLGALEAGPASHELAPELARLHEEDAIVTAAEEQLLHAPRPIIDDSAGEKARLATMLTARAGLDEAVTSIVGKADQLMARAQRESTRIDSLATGISVGMLILALVVVATLAVVLSQTLRRLNRASVFQQRVMGIVGHDLRSPLQAILLTATNLPRSDEDAPGFERSRDRIVRAARRMERLTGLLMDFTRIQVGLEMPISPHQADLHQLADQLVDEARSSHRDRQILHDQIGNGRGEFDDDRLAQVITNLLNNALTYSPEESAVRVVTTGSPAGLAIEVHNEGQIAAEVLPYVFEPFLKGQRGDNARLSAGLGLYVTRQVVEAHGGSVEVRSSEQEGTTFRVELPRPLRTRTARSR